MNQREKYVTKDENFTSAQCKRNIRIFQITGLDITVLIVPVIVLVWLESGLAFNEMLLLQGIFVLPILMLEVPSGSFADYWSRKGCTAVFHILFGIAMGIYALGNNFYMFAIAEFLAGIGVAFQTGSETALLYDSLSTVENDPNGKFGNILSKRMTVMFTGAAIGAILGGFVGSLTMIRMPIYIAIVGHFVFAILVWKYIEPPRLKARTPQAAIKKTIKSLKLNDLKAILLFSLTYTVFGRIAFWAVQHVLVEEFILDALGMGIILAGFNLCAAISSILIRSHVERFANYGTYLVILIIEILYFGLLIYIPSLIGILFISLLAQITRGIRTPLTQGLLQKFLESDMRATFVSLISLIGAMLYFILSVIIEVLDYSRNIALVISLLGMLIISILFLIVLLRRNHSKLPIIVSQASEVL